MQRIGASIAPRPRIHAGSLGVCTPLLCTKRSLHETGSGGGGVIFSQVLFFSRELWAHERPADQIRRTLGRYWAA